MSESDNKRARQAGPAAGALWIILGVLGAAIGFSIRGKLNEVEVIGFGNIPDQLQELGMWALGGAFIGAVIGFCFGRARALHHCRKAANDRH
jgi:hypothetical protein